MRTANAELPQNPRLVKLGRLCTAGAIGRMRLVPIRTAYREFPGVFFYIKFYRADFFFFRNRKKGRLSDLLARRVAH